ncbi:hypothetical protein WN943_010749 [Citrus x changshan-huyou]
MKFRGPLSWEEFTNAVLLRFGPTDYEDPSEALSHLKQTTTVVAYQEAFEKLSHQINGLPQHFLIGCFIAGLRDDIRLDVKIKQPRILADAIRVARHVEERNLLQRKARMSYPFQTSSVIPRTMPNTTASVLRPPPVQKINQNSNYYILPVAACQLVLGVQWLETLGPIETYYKKLTMTFRKGEGIHTFRGMEQAGIEALTGKHFLNLQGTGFFFQIIPANNNKDLNEYSPNLICLLNEFRHVFQLPYGLPPKWTHDHQIPLEPTTKPVSVRPYRYPYYQKNEIEKIVKELLQAGFIRPSIDLFLSLVLLVKKADGSWRFCVDYIALNIITVKDELLDELHGAKFFSELDLRASYHQIRVKGEDVPKTAFLTHEGYYEFLVMPFGLTNTPAIFQSLINNLSRPYLRRFILFFYDILVYFRTWEDHISHLRQVLEILSTNSLFAKESKCQFRVLQVEYLGHIISEKGVAIDPAKIQTVIYWPTPTTTKEFHGFLGLAGYYRKFSRNFKCIAAPLTRLLTKDSFHWNKDAIVAFNQLKTALTSPHVLRLPNFSQRFVIEYDASGIKTGAILSQQNRPIAYFSEALKGSALILSTYEKEMLITTPVQTRWLPKILGYDYEMEIKKGLRIKPRHLTAIWFAYTVLPLQLLVIEIRRSVAQWLEWIPWAEFSYNIATHSSTKLSPFEVVYGIPPPSLLAYVLGTSRVQAVDEYLRDRDSILHELQ